MEKTVKIRSMFLPVLNEALQKLTLNDKVKEVTPVIIEADGKFTSVIKTDNDLDLSNLSNEIDTEEEIVEKSNTKEQLLNKATDALKQTLTYSKNLEDVLKKLKKLSTEDDSYNEWVVNEPGNTASLKSKNAYIFKQNNNLCLSHNGKVELFKTVSELRKWLKDNKYPLPKEDTIIKESKETLTEVNWLDLVNDANNKKKVNLNINNDNSYDDYLTQHKVNSHRYITPEDIGLSKRVDPALFKGPAPKTPSKIPLVDLPEDDSIDECFGGVSIANLGSAVQYIGNKKKNESTQLNVFESIKNYPWLNKIMNQRLVEDDTPADFAKGSPLDSNTTNNTISSDMSNDNLTNTDNNTADNSSDSDLDNFDFDTSSGQDSNGFGDIDISVGGGYSPEDDTENEENPLPVNTPDYKIIDVLLNDEDDTDIKVKVQNTDTNKIEIKDLSDIDV